MTSTLMSSAATLGNPCSSSGLSALLPSLSCPGPALADTLAPDPLSLGDGYHPGAAPAIAPHPDVHLIEPAAVSPVPLRVCGGTFKTPIVLEAVWNSEVTVAADEARNEGGRAPARSRQGRCIVVTCLVWIHFSVWIVAAIACIRALCPGKIGRYKESSGHTVRIGSL